MSCHERWAHLGNTSGLSGQVKSVDGPWSGGRSWMWPGQVSGRPSGEQELDVARSSQWTAHGVVARAGSHRACHLWCSLSMTLQVWGAPGRT